MVRRQRGAVRHLLLRDDATARRGAAAAGAQGLLLQRDLYRLLPPYLAVRRCLRALFLQRVDGRQLHASDVPPARPAGRSRPPRPVTRVTAEGGVAEGAHEADRQDLRELHEAQRRSSRCARWYVNWMIDGKTRATTRHAAGTVRGTGEDRGTVRRRPEPRQFQPAPVRRVRSVRERRDTGRPQVADPRPGGNEAPGLRLAARGDRLLRPRPGQGRQRLRRSSRASATGSTATSAMSAPTASRSPAASPCASTSPPAAPTGQPTP